MLLGLQEQRDRLARNIPATRDPDAAMAVGVKSLMGTVATRESLLKMSMPDAVAAKTRPPAEAKPFGCAESFEVSPKKVLPAPSAILRVSSQPTLYDRSDVIWKAVT
jgi:hypothetical protein